MGDSSGLREALHHASIAFPRPRPMSSFSFYTRAAKARHIVTPVRFQAPANDPESVC